MAEEYGFELVEYEVSSDHVHIMLSFPLKRSIGEVVRIFKSIVARELFREFPWLKQQLWGGELWESGYFVRTIGDRVTSKPRFGNENLALMRQVVYYQTHEGF